MQTFTATDAKHHLGLVLDTAQKAPVSIEKQGRPFAVVMSQERFEIMEDTYLAFQADKAENQGFLGVKESKATLEKLRKKHAKS